MSGQDGVLELGQHGVLEPEHPGDQRLAGGDAGRGVAADLLGDGQRGPPGLAQRPQRVDVRRRRERDRQVDVCAGVVGAVRTGSEVYGDEPTRGVAAVERASRGRSGGRAAAVVVSHHVPRGGMMQCLPACGPRVRRADGARYAPGSVVLDSRYSLAEHGPTREKSFDRRWRTHPESGGHPGRPGAGPRVGPTSPPCGTTATGCSPGHPVVLTSFVVYASWAAFVNKNYYVGAPATGPDLSLLLPVPHRHCVPGAIRPHGITWWTISPALLILIFPLGFRMTCYYYRKAYYRSFWLAPPACAVSDAHGPTPASRGFPLSSRTSTGTSSTSVSSSTSS